MDSITDKLLGISYRLARDYDPSFFRTEGYEPPDMFRQAIEDVRMLLDELDKCRAALAKADCK